jgi:hypothetical protein
MDNFGTIGGGVNNDIEALGYESTIGGGNANSVSSGAYRSTISGGWNNAIESNSFQSVIGGGVDNTINTNAANSTITGGYHNTISGSYSTIAGGYQNNVTNAYATIGGGAGNTAGGAFGYTTVAGGYQNSATVTYASVGGGEDNSAAGSYAVVSGGFFNKATGTGADVAGGIGNTAGTQSFAAGASAHADSSDSFVWGDGSAATYDNGLNTFNALATGGYYLGGLYGKSVSGTPAAVYVNSSGQLGTAAPNNVFVQTANAGNIGYFINGSYFTVIANPVCNGNPNAILIVTPNNVSYQNYADYNHPICVDYNVPGYTGQWVIELLGGTINPGMQFNVVVASP